MPRKRPTDTPGRGQGHADILFRHMGDDVAGGAVPGFEWQVEYYDGRGFPVGLAWVLVPPPGPGVRPIIKFVLVADDSRRRGVATRLVEACRGRWPGVRLSLPISEPGARLYRKFTPPATAESEFNPEFIASQLAAGVSREELDQLAREQHDAKVNFGLKPLEVPDGPDAGSSRARKAKGRRGR